MSWKKKREKETGRSLYRCLTKEEKKYNIFFLQFIFIRLPGKYLDINGEYIYANFTNAQLTYHRKKLIRTLDFFTFITVSIIRKNFKKQILMGT